MTPPTTTRHAAPAGDIRRRPVPCAVRRRPAGTAAVPGWPATPRTIGVQRLAAPLTGTPAAGFRARLRTLTGRSEQLCRRAARRPAVGDHPTGQLRTGGQQDRRRHRRHGLGQQRAHLRDVAMTHPAQQFGGRQDARVEPGLRVTRVRAQGLHLGDPRTRRRRRLRAPPRQPRQRDRRPGIAAGKPQILERQRRTHPIPAQRGRPAHQRLPGRAVLPGHPPRRPRPTPRTP